MIIYTDLYLFFKELVSTICDVKAHICPRFRRFTYLYRWERSMVFEAHHLVKDVLCAFMLIAEKETIIHDANAANLIALHVGVVENVRIKRLCRNHISLSNCKNKCNCKN